MVSRLSLAVLVPAMLASFTPAHAETVVIRQHGREFSPAAVEIAVGDAIQIVNDDEGLLHHAWLDSPAFSFDIGEQEYGSANEIAFPVAGTFDVFCGIHPKMKLVVTVR